MSLQTKTVFSEHSVVRIISTVTKLSGHNKHTAMYNLVKVGLQCLGSEILVKDNEEYYFANSKLLISKKLRIYYTIFIMAVWLH